MESGAVSPPRKFTPGRISRGQAIVLAGFESASIVLLDSKSAPIRLDWESGGGTSKAISIPPGNYSLKAYRVIRKDANGTEWFTSAILAQPKMIHLVHDQETTLLTDDSISMMAMNRGDQLGMNIGGIEKSGLSIYKNGKRIPMMYELKDSSGKVVESGKMTYG